MLILAISGNVNQKSPTCKCRNTLLINFYQEYIKREGE